MPHNQCACMIRCMNVEETREVCKDRSRWRYVVSAYPMGKRYELMYVWNAYLINLVITCDNTYMYVK